MEKQSPYFFGPPVDEPYFCDRDDETTLLISRMNQGINVFLLSPRRYGKTSLLERVKRKFDAGGGRSAIANLFFCTNESDLANTILSSVLTQALTRTGRAKFHIEDILKHFRITPQITLSQAGSVDVSFAPGVAQAHWVTVVEDAMRLLKAAAGDQPAALILDEFQVVASIGPKGVGGAFKAIVDRTKDVSLVVAGSHFTTMEKLTSARGAPLYGMGERIVLDVVDVAPMTKYLRARARKFDMKLDQNTAELIYISAGGIPNYVQQLALTSFECSHEDGVIRSASVESAIELLIGRLGNEFAERFERLAPSQQRLLRELAARPTAKVYTKAVLDSVGVANANAIRTALTVLTERELVTSSGGIRYVADPFFREWLSRRS